MEQFFSVGVITTTHGVKGEVKVYPTTDDARRFKKCKELIVVDTGNNSKTYKVESVKFFKQFVILKLEGINTMDAALTLKNNKLLVTREQAVKLEKDEYFIADLIGVNVYDEDNNKLGVVEDVMQTGANDVYEIRKEDGSSFLVPAIKECILEVDVSKAFMRIHVMEGLLDV